MASPRLPEYLALLAITPLVLWSASCNDSCVAAGTPVATPSGWRPVEALAVGDPIFAVDLERGVMVATTVALIRVAERECLLLRSGDSELVVTPDHPIFAPAEGGFVEAGRAALGQVDEILRVDAADAEARPRRARIDAREAYAGVHRVYDIGVASEHHNFIAGGLVVHNKSSCGSDDCDGSTSEASATATMSATGTGTGTEGGTETGSASDTGSGSTGGGAAEGEPCGASSPCAAGLYCDFADDKCGMGEAAGSCVAAPASCDAGDAVLECGCDGTLADDACALNLAGTDLSLNENCEDAQHIACGSSYCPAGDACITYTPGGGEAFKTCDPAFAGECGLDCDCILGQHPECAGCTVDGVGVQIECAI